MKYIQYNTQPLLCETEYLTKVENRVRCKRRGDCGRVGALSFAICGCNSKEDVSWEGTYKCSYSVTNSGESWDLYNYTVVIDEKDEQLNISYEERVNGGGMVTIDIEVLLRERW